jgi:hypothetical protein
MHAQVSQVYIFTTHDITKSIFILENAGIISKHTTTEPRKSGPARACLIRWGGTNRFKRKLMDGFTNKEKLPGTSKNEKLKLFQDG